MDGDWIELQEYAGRHVGLAGVARPFFSVAQLVLSGRIESGKLIAKDGFKCWIQS